MRLHGQVRGSEAEWKGGDPQTTIFHLLKNMVFPLNFKGDLSLLEIFLVFSKGLKQMEVILILPPTNMEPDRGLLEDAPFKGTPERQPCSVAGCFSVHFS